MLTLDVDPKLQQALGPHLARVLVLDHMVASSRMLCDLLHNIRRGQIWQASATGQALSMAQTANPQVIFVEYDGPDVDGLAFTRTLRRSNFACRKVPVIMITGQATPSSILGARDAGVHEFLRKPYTNKDLIRRLDAALLRPRGWVEAVGYIGPDRRRFNSAEYRGARKRRSDQAKNAEEAVIMQALRIVAAAAGAIETDRNQAFRSLCTQATDLQRAAAATGNDDLRAAAAELQHCLGKIGAGERLTRAAADPFLQKVLAFMPKDATKAA